MILMVLLANSFCKRGCNYKEILVTFREVVFVELRNLNLTDSIDTSKVGNQCPSRKARRILVSIYNMTKKMRCQRMGEQQAGLVKPIEGMEQLILYHCNPEFLNINSTCPTVQKKGRKKKRRARLIQDIHALVTCWQKLQAVVLSK